MCFPFCYRAIPDVPAVSLQLTNKSVAENLSDSIVQSTSIATEGNPSYTTHITTDDNPAYITHGGTAEDLTYATPSDPLPTTTLSTSLETECETYTSMS